MTEIEKKAFEWMQNIRDDAVVTLDHIAKNEPRVSPMLYRGRKEKAEAIINAFEELERYREIETELKEKYHANVDIKELVQYFIETIFKGEKHERFCVLTNEDAKKWDAYNAAIIQGMDRQ